jgi:hypothetical protein
MFGFSIHDVVLVGVAVALSQVPSVTAWFAKQIASVKRKLAVAEAAIKADEAAVRKVI